MEKMAVAFAKIFMADIEPKMISQSITKPREWKRYIDDIFSLWDSDKQEITLFIEQANNFHDTMKFTAATYHPSVRNLKNILMLNWDLIQNQPLLNSIFKDPPIISYKRGKSLKDMLVRAKI